MLDRERARRGTRCFQSRLRAANLRHSDACMEDVSYRTPRGLNRALFQSLGGAPDTASLVGGAAPGARAPPVDTPPRDRRP